MKVELNPQEIYLAGCVGTRRISESIASGFHSRGYKNAPWEIDCEGACAELAVAKALGLYWNGSVNTFRMVGDVRDLEVRSTSKPGNNLLIKDNDRDDSIFVLVIGTAPEYEIVGWYRGDEARLRDDWQRRLPSGQYAWIVPKAELHPIEALKLEMEKV